MGYEGTSLLILQMVILIAAAMFICFTVVQMWDVIREHREERRQYRDWDDGALG